MITDIAATLFGGSFGAVISIIKSMIDNAHDQKMRDCDAYYEYMHAQSKDKHFKFTRRIIAIVLVIFIPFALCAGAFGHIPVIIGYQESNGVFSWIFSGKSDIKWMTFSGFVLPPALWFLVGQVVSSYFVAKKR